MFSKFFIRSYPFQQSIAILFVIVIFVVSFILNTSEVGIDTSFSILHMLKIDLEQLRIVFIVLGFLLLIVLGLFMTSVVVNEKIIPSKSYLLVLVFLLLCIPYFRNSELNSEFFAFMFIAPAYSILLSFSQSLPKYKQYTDIGLLTGLASVFYAPALLFLILIFIVLSINNLFSWRAWLIPIFTIITVHLLAFTLVFGIVNVNMVEYFDFYSQQFEVHGFDFTSFSNIAGLFSIMLLLSYIVSMAFLFKGLTKKLIMIRKVFLFTFWASILIPLFGFFYLSNFLTVLLYWSLPLSLIFTNYYTFRKKFIFLKEFLFIGLIAISIIYFIY